MSMTLNKIVKNPENKYAFGDLNEGEFFTIGETCVLFQKKSDLYAYRIDIHKSINFHPERIVTPVHVNIDWWEI